MHTPRFFFSKALSVGLRWTESTMSLLSAGQYMTVTNHILSDMTGFFFVYILKLSNGKFYVGRTSDLLRRIVEHNSGKVLFTKSKRPVRLIYYSAFESQFLAIQFEKYLKSGSGRAFMNKRLL